MRPVYMAIAYISLGLGATGALLPLLPTTPFLLLAVWAAFRGSPRLARRLIRHHRFGPPIRQWHRQRAIAPSVKALACTLIAVSLGVLWGTATAPPGARIGVTLLLTAVVLFLLTRPHPTPGRVRNSMNTK